MNALPTPRVENPALLSALTLAYMGDAVYEMYVRGRLLERGYVKVNELHQTAVEYVRARAQARALVEVHPALTPMEQDIVRRARNAKGHAAPKGSDPAEYAAATSFEALIGFLYLTGQEERLYEVLATATRYLEQS